MSCFRWNLIPFLEIVTFLFSHLHWRAHNIAEWSDLLINRNFERVGKYKWKFLIKIWPSSSLLTFKLLNFSLAWNLTWELTVTYGILNTVGTIGISYPIIRFTFFNLKIMMLTPAYLLNVQYSQLVEMSIIISRCIGGFRGRLLILKSFIRLIYSPSP